MLYYVFLFFYYLRFICSVYLLFSLPKLVSYVYTCTYIITYIYRYAIYIHTTTRSIIYVMCNYVDRILFLNYILYCFVIIGWWMFWWPRKIRKFCNLIANHLYYNICIYTASTRLYTCINHMKYYKCFGVQKYILK